MVYDSFNGSNPGNLIYSQEIYFEENGWHSIDIEPYEVLSNDEFFIAVKIYSAYAISYDGDSEMSSRRSYYSSDGINYQNYISDYGNINIRSKVRFSDDLFIQKNKLKPNYITLPSAYPNPFNPITSIRYGLPNDGLVNITIYDMMGRIVKTLVNGSQTAGYKSTQWNATNDRNELVPAGLYLYTIQAGESRQTKKMILLK